MTDLSTLDSYGTLIEPATLKIERVLPGPIERVWAYLTQSDLRSQWLASGDMDLRVGAPFEFVWHNDELTNPPGQRPPGYSAEHRMESRIKELDPPRKLGFMFGAAGAVVIELKSQGHDVRLTVVHSRVPDRGTLLSVSAGWHSHLDLLVDRLTGSASLPHWDHWTRLKADYGARLPE